MYCKKCGQQMDDSAKQCPKCGVVTDNFWNASKSGAGRSPAYTHQEEKNTVAVVGFVFAFLIALVGLICSIIGFRRAKNEGLERGGLALAGIIISVINMVLGFILFL